MVKVKRRPDEFHPPYYDLDLYYLSLATTGTAKEYSEGTWTPALTFGGGATGMTYTLQDGYYTKVGLLVQLQGRIVLSAKGSSTGAAVISGAPFTIVSVAPVAVSRALSMTGLTGALSAFGTVGNITLRQSAATGDAAVTDANFTNTTDIAFAFAYRTA